MNEVEGILINKFPYQDKNLIGHLLLRNGMKLSVLFYGGQGGGKKRVSSILQIGFLFTVTLGKRKNKSFQMLNARDYSEKWFHDNISSDPKSFYLLCFFCEFIDKFSPVATETADLETDYDTHKGMFSLLANGIFQLEKMGKEKSFNLDLALFTFLAKALVEIGIFPRTEKCAISGIELTDSSDVILQPASGGFAFRSEVDSDTRSKDQNSSGQTIRNGILKVVDLKYGELDCVPGVNINCCKEILEYICFQQNVHIRDFKTASLLF